MHPRCAVVFLLAACAGAPSRSHRAPPDVPVVANWPAGTRFRTGLATNVPDERTNRAAAIWWREALRQTVAFELLDGRGDGPTLELAIDPATKSLAALWRDGTSERALAGATFADGNLCAAIDQLAWSARIALGERCEEPVPVADGTSLFGAAVLDVDDASALLRDGGFLAARRILRAARARDGGSPFVLDGVATLELLAGDLDAAERTAHEALAYEERMLPTTQHRLARTLLLARASRDPDHAGARDRELLTLAEVAARERPHDPEPLLSKALASNFLGDFATARELLLGLVERVPAQAIVAYHLGWAQLGTGNAAAATDCFERAAARLPVGWVLLPRAIALHEAGRHGELRDLLASLRGGDAADDRPLALDVLRMQAAEALLTGDGAQARTFLLATLTWLLKNPQVLAQRAGELAEQGALLVRLGAGAELPPLLAAMQQQHTGGAVAEACSFVTALADVHRLHERNERVEQNLSHGGDSPWGALLAAYAHEVRGEVADMQQALARAARLSGSPMTKTLLARGLQRAGRNADAAALLTALRREMKTINLRAPCRHPLLGPELAFAFVDA